MLDQFVISRTFYTLNVRIHVDLRRKEANLYATYERRLVMVDHPVPLQDAATPERAEAFLSRHVGEHGSLLETLYARFQKSAACNNS